MIYLILCTHRIYLKLLPDDAMKHKLSITVDEDVILKMREKIREGTFRNKSHLVEYSVKKLLEETEV